MSVKTHHVLPSDSGWKVVKRGSNLEREMGT